MLGSSSVAMVDAMVEEPRQWELFGTSDYRSYRSSITVHDVDLSRQIYSQSCMICMI